MFQESRISGLEAAISALSKAFVGTKKVVDTAILAVSGQGCIPAFSVMPYEGGYRMWCPPGTKYTAGMVDVDVVGADENGWIHLGNQSGDVYCFIRNRSYVAEVQIGKPAEGSYEVCTLMARIGTK